MAKAKHTKRSELDFDELLSKGAATYDSAVGHWWHEQSLDGPHRRAYEHIAKVAAGLCLKQKIKPQWIVDYACGGGALLGELLHFFPQSKLVGLDGSDQLLLNCQKSHPAACGLIPSSKLFHHKGHQVQLCLSALPNFNLPKGKADLVFLVFPNLVPDDKHLEVFNRHGYCHKQDVSVGRMLARFREMDPEDDTPSMPEEDLFDELMTSRVFSRNLRTLLRPGGILARVEYSQAPREQLTELIQWRSLFAECALEQPIKGEQSVVLFKYLGSEFRRSKVILDVFHQTGDPDDTRGGYMVSFFEAV